MKIKKFKRNTKKILKLHIVKTRIYEQKSKNNSLNILPEINLFQVLIKLKKSLSIIYQFHKRKKNILFIGMPKRIEQKINLKTNHVALPKFFNINGLFINPSVEKNLKKNSQKTFSAVNFSKLSIKPHLVVLLDSMNNENIRKEAYQTKIPIIEFNTSFIDKNKFYSYDVPGNIDTNKQIVNDLFFKIINSILKK